MFSGVGGFELGLLTSEHNIELVGLSEIDKYASQILKTKSKESKIMEMQKELFPQNSHNSTSLLEGFLAKLFLWLDSEEAGTTLGVHSFLISQGFLEKESPSIYYSKTLKVYFLTKMDVLSRQSLKFSPTLGIWCNGKYSIVKTSECLRIGKECLLSDILEESVDQKYFLSEKAMKRMVFK